jgi:hypothetical protein
VPGSIQRCRRVQVDSAGTIRRSVGAVKPARVRAVYPIGADACTARVGRPATCDSFGTHRVTDAEIADEIGEAELQLSARQQFDVDLANALRALTVSAQSEGLMRMLIQPVDGPLLSLSDALSVARGIGVGTADEAERPRRDDGNFVHEFWVGS